MRSERYRQAWVFTIIERLESVSRETRFDGVRVRFDSAKSYDELVAALLAEIGERPVPINDFATATDGWDSYRERVEPHVGPSGFMLFGLIDHGAWITKAGSPCCAMTWPPACSRWSSSQIRNC